MSPVNFSPKLNQPLEMTFQSKHASRFMSKYSGDTCYIRDKYCLSIQHCLSIQFKVVL